MTFGLRILKGNLIAISLIGSDEALRKNWIFRIIQIRIIGSFIAKDNREKSRDCPSSSNNPVVSDNHHSDNRDLTVFTISCYFLFAYIFCFCLFVWFDSLRPINNLSIKQGQVFLGWTSTKLGSMCLPQGPQCSDAGEARTRGPSVSSQVLYHWSTVLLPTALYLLYTSNICCGQGSRNTSKIRFLADFF